MRGLFLSLKKIAACLALLTVALAGNAQADQTLKLGVFVTASGPGADLGSQMRAGIEVAIDRISKHFAIAGEPAKIEVFWYDDEGKGDVGLSAVMRALTIDKINVALGFNSTDIVSRVVDEFQKSAVPFITCCAGGRSIFNTIAAKQQNYVFQLSPTADDMIPSLGAAVLANYKPKKIGALNYSIDAAREQTAMALKYFTENSPGAEIIGEEYVPLGTTDFTQQLLKLKRLGADLIYSDIYGAGGPIFFQQYNELKVPAVIAHLGTSVSSDTFVADNGNAMNGSFVNVRWVEGSGTDLTKSMVEDYTKKVGSSPTAFAVQAHDSATVMLEAVRTANSLDPNAIVSALEKGTFTGAWGERKFTDLASGHRMPAQMTIVQIQDGKKMVIWPDTARAAAGTTFKSVPPFSWEGQ